MIAHEPTATIIYPESDGQPMSDNTLQVEWIVTLKEGLDACFSQSPDVFVAGDLLWYPVEGEPRTRIGPDVLVAFGRPKGYRGSYRQWEEGNIAPKVVFEILSPENRMGEMARKFDFYERFGVEEYYLYNPSTFDFSGWHREDDRLRLIEFDAEWVSPVLRGVRFVAPGDRELEVYAPNGERFLTYGELKAAYNALQSDTKNEREGRLRAQEGQRQAEEKAAQLAARLREMGIDPDTI